MKTKISKTDKMIQTANKQFGYERISKPGNGWSGTKLLVAGRSGVVEYRISRNQLEDYLNGWIKVI